MDKLDVVGQFPSFVERLDDAGIPEDNLQLVANWAQNETLRQVVELLDNRFADTDGLLWRSDIDEILNEWWNQKSRNVV
jgi:hypothetical protein